LKLGFEVFEVHVSTCGRRLWSLWAKVSAVGNAQRCPRQARRCAEGASSTNPQPVVDFLLLMLVWQSSCSLIYPGVCSPS
jgi:hypothetical protein